MAVAIHHKLLFQNHIAITSHRVYKACSWSQVSEWTNNPYWRKKVNRQQINQHSMFKYQIVKQGSHHKSFKSSLFLNVKADPKPKDLNSIMKCWNWYRAIARTLHNQLAIGSFWAKFFLLNLVNKHTVLILSSTKKTRSFEDECSTRTNNHLRSTDLFGAAGALVV